MKLLSTIFLTATLCTLSVAAEVEKTAPVKVVIDVPNPSWSLKIKSIYKKGGELLVICQMKQANGMAPAVISKASDTVSVPKKFAKLPSKIYVLNRGWNWGKGYTAITRKELVAVVKDAEKVFPAKEIQPKASDRDFVGLTLKEAKVLAGKRKLKVRVVSEDGKMFPVTMDYWENRINLSLVNGRVVETNRG